jgi:hypothetical protein
VERQFSETIIEKEFDLQTFPEGTAKEQQLAKFGVTIP